MLRLFDRLSGVHPEYMLGITIPQQCIRSIYGVHNLYNKGAVTGVLGHGFPIT